MDTVNLLQIIATILALLIAIVGHEIMHGYVAYLHGDTTAKNAGRLSINPIKHIDPVGTLLVPALLYFSGAPFMFGWAKPVPIFIPTVIRNGGLKGALQVSLAGIAYNFTLAIICSLAFSMFKDLHTVDNYFSYFLAYFLVQSTIYNVVLGMFNLYPIPPLDGSHALAYIAAMLGWNKIVDLIESLQRYGMFILLLFIATPLSKYFFAPIHYVIRLFV